VRVQAPFLSLLSFTHSDLARAIERAASLEIDPGSASEAADIAESARLATAQLSVAHRLFMEMVGSPAAPRYLDEPVEATSALRELVFGQLVQVPGGVGLVREHAADPRRRQR
jgi:hypothetical protein